MTRRRLLAAAAGALALATAIVGSSPSSGSPAQAGSSAVGATSASGEDLHRVSSSTAPGNSLTGPIVNPTGPIVLIGTSGLSWSDVSARTTPALWSLMRGGATAALTVHSAHANTCPVDGWLTLSAGEQVADSRGSVELDRKGGAKPPCRALPAEVTAGKVPRWAEYGAAAAATRFDASLGLLGDQIASHGLCVQAVGPGAALGAARSNGIVNRHQPFDSSTLAEAMTRCPATLIDVGSVRDPDDVDPGDETRPTTTRAQQVAVIDDRVAAVLRAAPKRTDVLLASLADAGVTERLRLVAARGPQFGAGTLETGSTRQPGLVQLADLTPTILRHLGIAAPRTLGGAPLLFLHAGTNSEQSAEGRHRTLLDYDQASHQVHSLVPPFFTGYVLLQLALYLIATMLWVSGRGTETQRLRLLRVTHRFALFAATVPASTFLANLLPWWRFSKPTISVVASVVLFATAITLLALLGPWRRRLLGPLVVVCAATMAILAIDVMTGSRLQIASLMGEQPLVGGRFYGMGNVTFALFGTATLMLCIAMGDHLVSVGRSRSAAGAVAATGLLAVIVDGSPSWGSDLGGPTALLPAVVILVLTILQIRLSLLRLLYIGSGIGAAVLLLGLLDWLRPAESRTHLGRFVQTALDGGAWDVIARKLDQNLTLLFGTPLLLLVPLGLVLFAYLLARPSSRLAAPLSQSFERVKLLRTGLITVIVMWVIGFALNDSGAAIPAAGATLALPLLIAVALRTLEEEQAAEPSGAAAARPSQLRR